jgi:cytochrome c oxidase subunit I
VSAVGALPAPPPSGLLDLAAGTDHKSLGKRLILGGFGFFLAAGVLALIMRSELATPGLQVTSTKGYNELFTIHGSTMFYLFATPVALGMGVYLVPLQIGASSLAGARWALAGWWMIVMGGVVMWSGWFTQRGAADVGWYAYDPLSDSPYSPGMGTDFWVLGVFLAAIGSILVAAAILATVVAKRAPGMTMLRIPVFTWTVVVTVLMTITAFPALAVAMGALWAQRQFGGVFTLPGGPITYQHLFWFYGHPVVYVVFFPALGAVAESIAIFSGRRFFGYKAIIGSLLVFAALSMSVWGHHMFTENAVSNRYFSLTSTLLLVVAGIEYFDCLATMWRGSIRLTTSMLFALGFLAMFVIGGVTGIWIASPPLDYQATDSYFIVGHFHYTLFGGSVLGMFAGLYLWWPKATGTLLREGLGKVHFWLTIVGMNLTFFPMFFLGQEGMSRRIADYPRSTGWEGLNILSTVGSGVLAISVLVLLANMALSRGFGAPAGPDPWGGQTLEWWTTSPPPAHNFATLPPVRTFAPLLDLRRERAAIDDPELPDQRPPSQTEPATDPALT